MYSHQSPKIWHMKSANDWLRGLAPAFRSAGTLCLLMLLASPGASAQSAEKQLSEAKVITVRPGDPRVDGHQLPSVTASWRVTRTAPGGEESEVGVWTDTWKVVERDGEELQRFETVVTRVDQDLRHDITYKRLPTLAVAAVELFNYNGKGGWAYLHYDAGRATSVFRREQGSETLSESEDLGERVFSAGSEVELLQFFEPAVGLKLRYPTHDQAKGGIVWVTAQVVGRQVDDDGAFRGTEVWLVENSLQWKYRLLTHPPYVLRLETTTAGGVVTRWELIDYRLLAKSGTDGRHPVMADGDSRLDGVWRLVMAEVIGPDGVHRPGHAQESFLMFSKDYYSMNWAGGKAPAPFSAKPLRPTDAEKITRYSSLIVNAGRFEVSDGKLTIRHECELGPEYVGGLGEFDYAVSGDTLDLVWRTIESADGTPDPATAAGVRFHYTWIRR